MEIQFLLTNEMGVKLIGSEDELRELIINGKVLVDEGQPTERMMRMLSFQTNANEINPQSLLGLNDDS